MSIDGTLLTAVSGSMGQSITSRTSITAFVEDVCLSLTLAKLSLEVLSV